ncbi:hypothetical protein FJ987_13645 [Mesorhizobium sp. CU2]|uniref:hypothetical protein n=1 Tax=unclassified Mesorhizobium TaxID=325217 RepID=UPI001126F760|nr:MULTISPECIES: hypothetical protein [unclassified Mesorhizobium]TPN88152.1 hypothetical protein FJ988_03645 [Mesorhizobium sp. CU3]TPO14683.1 hypothetical protein FJ987_13645 [Mesorhizobium sp. CU2]
MHSKALLALIIAAIAPMAAAAAEDPVGFVQRELAKNLIEPLNYELVSNQSNRAVVSLTAIAPEVAYFKEQLPAQRMNLYVYLVRDGESWGISGSANAMPKPARMSFRYGLSQSAADMTNTSSVTLKRAEWIHSHAVLVASTDDVLIAHFRKKRETIDRIRDKVRIHGRSQYPNIDHDALGYKDLLDEASIEYVDLKNGIGGDETESCGFADCFALILAFDSPHYEIGYLHVTRPEDVPPISEGGYIVVRSLGDGWYFFRRV